MANGCETTRPRADASAEAREAYRKAIARLRAGIRLVMEAEGADRDAVEVEMGRQVWCAMLEGLATALESRRAVEAADVLRWQAEAVDLQIARLRGGSDDGHR